MQAWPIIHIWDETFCVKVPRVAAVDKHVSMPVTCEVEELMRADV